MKQVVTWVRFRIIIILLVSVGIFIAIFIKTFKLQVTDRDKLKSMADKQIIKTINIIPKRGTIYDRGMQELAVSMEVDSIYAMPAKIKDIKKTAKVISSIISVNRKGLEDKFRTGKFVWVKRQVNFAEAERLKKLNIPGIGFVKEGKRFYPGPQIAAQLIGFVGIDSTGLEGIERGYDKYMAGKPVKLIGERDALGEEIFFTSADKDVSKGMDIVLTIDKTIQHIAERELSNAVSKTQAKGGMAIVINPKTGEILAMANAPNVKPDQLSNYNNPGIWRNRAIADAFEPGSTYKAFLLAAILEEGIVKPTDVFFCEDGKYNVADRTFHDVKKFGWLTFSQIIKYSSNIGAAKVGEKLGSKKLYRYMKDFGFGSKTGIGLPGESSGSLPNLKDWSKVTQGNISFGQGISVTGVQIISAFASIANQGYLMKPYVVKKMIDEEGAMVEEFHPSVVRRIISEETARKATNMLKEVTKEGGTGAKAAIDGFEVAGKTGTAQKPDISKGGYADGKYVSSFIGFVPADNPEIAILVTIDEPAGEFYGGAIAAPVFREIAVNTLTYLGIFPKTQHADYKEQILEEQPYSSLETLDDGTNDGTEDISNMPDVKGKTIRSVMRLAREIPIDIKISGSGKAVYQKPLPGEKITQGALAEVRFE